MSRTVQELQKRVDILVKSLEKEIVDAKNGKFIQAGHAPNIKRKNVDKKRESARAKDSEVDEDMIDDDCANENLDDMDMREATSEI